MKRFCGVMVLLALTTNIYALPGGFVYLDEVDASILQEMRYAGSHNFIGRPVNGYESNTCILTEEAAHALTKVQQVLLKKSLSLKVYDCYRPTRAVDDFMTWSQDMSRHEMKQEFYPRVNKQDVFELGYVARKSGHSRGSTIDLTIVPIPAPMQAQYRKGQPLVSCIASYQQRFHDNSIDMGTGFDCLDEAASPDYHDINTHAYQNRMLLRQMMMQNGFQPYEKEWWHFTLNDEPYPNTYFNFVVRD